MSFVDGFFSYLVELTDTDRQVYVSVRFKTAKHPAETLLHLTARVCAYLHCYQEDLVFSEGLYQPKQPTIWRRDITGAVWLWAQVGAVQRKKLEQAARNHPQARRLVYFYATDQINASLTDLQRSKSPCFENFEFYRLESAPLERLAERSRSRSHWSFTISDQIAYLSVDGHEEQLAFNRLHLHRWTPANGGAEDWPDLY